MALNAQVVKVDIGLTNLDSHIYHSQRLTLAMHPSETQERFMVRLLSWALQYDAGLQFGKGLSSQEEPDLWLRNDMGEIVVWIDVGLPSEERIRKACAQSKQVNVYAYGTDGMVNNWWAKIKKSLKRFDKLKVRRLEYDRSALEAMFDSSMQIQATIEDAVLMLSSDHGYIDIGQTDLVP